MLLGPPPAVASYLDSAKLIAAARATNCQAIHPGYGFLSEQAGFARLRPDLAVDDALLVPPRHMRRTFALEEAVAKLEGAYAAVAVPSVPDDHDSAALVPEVLSWPETFRRLASGALTGRAAKLEEMGFVELVRNGDEMDGLVDL